MIFCNSISRHLKNDDEFCRALKVFTLPIYIGTARNISNAFGNATDFIGDDFVGNVWEFIDTVDNKPFAWLEENSKTGEIDIFAPIKTDRETLFNLIFYIGIKIAIR